MTEATTSDLFRTAPAATGAGSAVRGAVAWAGAVLLGVWMTVALHAFTPDVPKVGLDASWIAVMAEGADRGWRWGSDIIFTYGPASTLVTRYGSDAYLTLTLPLLLAICLLFAGCALRLVNGCAARTIVIVTALGIAAVHISGTPDATFLVLPLLPALIALSPGLRTPATMLLIAVTAAAAGAAGLAKMSYLATALPIFLVADIAAIVRRRVPLLTLPFVAGFVLSDLAYGQNLADLPLFLRQQGEVVAGYSEAMALDGSRRELLAFVLSAGALWLGAVRRPDWRERLPMAFCVAWTLFMLFKAGFVRQDLHTLIAWNGLAVLAIVVAGARPNHWRRSVAWIVLVTALAGTVAASTLASGQTAGTTADRLASALDFESQRLIEEPLVQFSAATALLRDPAGALAALRDERADAWRAAAAAEPLPPLTGGVDVIPSRQNAVVAAGLDYRPRPSFQEYSTYTEELSAANRVFVEGPRAPAWILFGREPGSSSLTLDNRYPNFAEGALWPDLLRLYRPDGRIGDLVALHRRERPAGLDLGEPRRSVAALGEEVAVEAGAPAVFATVDVRPTLLGRLAGILFRPAPLLMTMSFSDGTRRIFQFISGIGRSGFVLSPLVTDAAEFEDLAGGTAPPPGRRVVGFSIAPRPHLGWLVAPDVTVTQQILRVATTDRATP